MVMQGVNPTVNKRFKQQVLSMSDSQYKWLQGDFTIACRTAHESQTFKEFQLSSS